MITVLLKEWALMQYGKEPTSLALSDIDCHGDRKNALCSVTSFLERHFLTPVVFTLQKAVSPRVLTDLTISTLTTGYTQY